MEAFASLGASDGLPVFLLDNYDSFTWNVAQYLAELGARVTVARNDVVTVAQVEQRAPVAVVVSPGPCTPDDAGISLPLIAAVRGRIPLLGVCLGHQSIGQVYGARVVRAAAPMHGKTSKVFHDEQGLFAGVTNPVTVMRYHSLVIEPASLPASLEVTAKTWDNEIMGVRARGPGAPVEGVQFHPESIMTDAGKIMLGNFLLMAGEFAGVDASAVRAQLAQIHAVAGARAPNGLVLDQGQP